MTSLLKFRELFKSTHCAVIGMIHVPALPGTPFNKMKCSQIVETACEEAEVYKKCGVVRCRDNQLWQMRERYAPRGTPQI